MTTARTFAVCVGNAGYEVSLERRKIYEVVPDVQAGKLGQVRIVDESGESYLYPSALFAVIELPQPLRKAILKAA